MRPARRRACREVARAGCSLRAAGPRGVTSTVTVPPGVTRLEPKLHPAAPPANTGETAGLQPIYTCLNIFPNLKTGRGASSSRVRIPPPPLRNSQGPAASLVRLAAGAEDRLH